jgi:hypothetical protein
MIAEITSEPRQPSRLEKRKNIAVRFPYGTAPERALGHELQARSASWLSIQ